MHTVGISKSTRRLGLLAALLVPALALAQAGDSGEGSSATPAETPDTSGPARPKLKQDGPFRVESNDQSYRYLLSYHFESSGGHANLESHVFYPPPYQLVLTKDGKVKFDFDNDEGTLTLWVRQPTSFERIEKDLRRKLATTAVERHNVTILEGTKPYRINVLPLNSAVFEFTKTKKRSGEVKGAELKEGDVAVHFHSVSEAQARKLVSDLELDVTQLLFRYTFSGISDEVCTARFETRGVQDIDLFRKVKGKGKEGLVARHQVANIADELVAQEIFTIRCADGATLADLTDILMTRLASQETRAVASWDDLERLIAFDPDSFKADVTTHLRTVEKEVDREQALEAFSEAMSNAESEAIEGGVELGYSLFSAKAEASYAETSSDSRAGAGKAFTDALRKMGMSVDWDGEKFVPKSVDVHSVADLDAKWARNLEFKYEIPEGQEGGGAILLTADDRAAMTSGKMRRQFDHRLAKVEAAMKDTDARLAFEETATAEVSARLPSASLRDVFHSDEETFSLRMEDHKAIRIEARGERTFTNEDGEAETDGYDVDIRATDDVDIRATDDVDVRADDDVDIGARDTVWIRARGVSENARRGRRANRGRVDIKATGDVTIRAEEDSEKRADGDVSVRADGTLDLRGKTIRFNRQPHISVGTCRYNFQREDSERSIHNFYRNLGRTDDVAAVAGITQSCNGDYSPELQLHRNGRNSDDWILRVSNWRECRRLYVDVVFMDGFGVAKNDTYLTGDFGRVLTLERTWCNG